MSDRLLTLRARSFVHQVKHSLTLLKPGGSHLQRKLRQATSAGQRIPIRQSRIHPKLHGLDTGLNAVQLKALLFYALGLGSTRGFMLSSIEPGICQVVGVNDVTFETCSSFGQFLGRNLDALPRCIPDSPGSTPARAGGRRSWRRGPASAR